MWIPGQPEVNREYAVQAAGLWAADADTIEHIGDFGNSVYSFKAAGSTAILRLTNPRDRSQPVNQAELDFLLHLKSSGVQVSIPLPSRRGHLIEPVSVDDTELLASVFDYAPGLVVTPESPHWGEAFFRAWGRTLAHIHEATRVFEPIAGRQRWHWQDEDLIANARRYIPADDTLSLRELDTLQRHLSQLPISRETYGLIHADLGNRNFHYDPDNGITVFDFGNCCYHWFVADITITLSTLRHYPERDQYRDWLLAGYAEIFPVDLFLFSQHSWFMRLRILYVYLDRLMIFGGNPSESQRETLCLLRHRVHEGFGR